MKIYKNIEQRSFEWLDLRRGKLTGTLLKKIVGGAKARESCFYEVLAERLSVADVGDAENAMERGIRLEGEALSEFEKKSKKLIEPAAFVESETRGIGYSPDGLMKTGKKYTEDIEIKCLSSGNHVRAWLTGEVPEEYMPQIIQGFIVIPDLQVRHVVFYDPRIAVKPYFVIKVERENVADMIQEYVDVCHYAATLTLRSAVVSC